MMIIITVSIIMVSVVMMRTCVSLILFRVNPCKMIPL